MNNGGGVETKEATTLTGQRDDRESFDETKSSPRQRTYLEECGLDHLPPGIHMAERAALIRAIPREDLPYRVVQFLRRMTGAAH